MLKALSQTMKYAGDLVLLLALAASPLTQAQNVGPTRDERLAERQTNIDARRESINEREGRAVERNAREMRNPRERVGENPVHPRRRAFENQAGAGEFARRRYGAGIPPTAGERPQRPQFPARPGVQ